MERIVMDVNRMQPFMAFLAKTCNDFCENQVKIDRAYQKVQETWRDKNCHITGQRLRETGEDIKRFYGEICVSIRLVKQYCEKVSDYIEVELLPIQEPDEFRMNIMECDAMANFMVDTDPQALISFKNALDTYIQSIGETTQELRSEYNTLGNERAWQDVQYERFGEALGAFERQMNEELWQLSVISKFLQGRIAKLENI